MSRSTSRAFHSVIALGMWVCTLDARADITNGVHEFANLKVGPGVTFTQSGGAVIVSNSVTVEGWYGRRQEPMPASYALHGGNLSCRELSVYFGGFTQSGGTNEVAETLSLSGSNERSEYRLAGGVLITSNVALRPSGSGGFRLEGGQHVTGELELNGRGWRYDAPAVRLYTLTAGELVVRRITVADNAIFQHAGGTLNHYGRLVLAMGHWEAMGGEQVFGPLLVTNAAYGWHSSMLFPDGPAVMRFRQSSHIPWGANALLRIRNWAGATNGGGPHQLVAGTNHNGLSAAQLRQIRFLDPVGLPAGEYAATKLGTGEIVPAMEVPARGPELAYQRDVRGMLGTLEWPSGYVVQSATNVAGPYTDALGFGASPATVYANPLSEPMRFYRLRHWTTTP